MTLHTRPALIAATLLIGLVGVGSCSVPAPEKPVPTPEPAPPPEPEAVEEVVVTAGHRKSRTPPLPRVRPTLNAVLPERIVLDADDTELWVIAKAAQAPEEFAAPPPPEYGTTHRDASDPGTGAMLASRTAPDAPEAVERVPLPLEHTAVDAAIAGYIGTVQVNQRFANPFDTKIEAVYLFPLPEKAAVSEFLMVIGDRTIRGILREKEEAEQIYRAARAQGYRASLLVQRRPNIFEQKVANIEPGKAIEVDITYFHTLAYKDGWYSFVFPTVVGPRYNPAGHSDPIAALPRGGKTTSPNATGVEYLAPTERSGHDLGITVRLDAGVAIEELKSTHEIVVEEQGSESTVVRLARETTIPNRDFVLDFRVAGETIKSNLLTHRDPETGEGYFTLQVIPPRDARSLSRQPMEMVFVIDCSGSMNGRPLEQAKEAVTAALTRLRRDDTFQIIRFSDGASQFGPTPVRATPRNLAAARRYLATLDGSGGTEMLRGVETALGFPQSPQPGSARGLPLARKSPSHLRFVSFMTDGYIGNEADVLAAVHRNIGNARIFSFGVGSSVNRYLMERMASEGRGVAAYLGLRDSAQEVMSNFFDRVSHPALRDVEIDWGGMEVRDTYPRALPDLFVGRPLVVAGRFEGTPGTLTLSGTAGDARRTLAVATHEGSPAAPYIAKVWARLSIADLTDRQATAGDPHGELGDSIRRIALRHQLVSSYTSFVAVDSSMRTEGTHGVTVHQAVPVPDGVRYDTTVE